MEYHELEKTHKDHPVQALALQRTPKNPPLCWERCPNPNPWGLCPMTLWGKNFFQKSNLNPSAQTPAVYQLLPTSQPLFLSVFHRFLVSPKLYLGSFLQQQLHAVGISYHAGAVQGFEGAVQAVHVSALGSTGTPPGSGIHPSHPLRKG